MATAKKLPSGSWRCLVFSHVDETGKRRYRSFTCDDPSARGKRKCEAMAAEWAANKEVMSRTSVTVKSAAEEYVAARTSVLSPRTLDSYESYIRNYIPMIGHIRVDDITQADVQRFVNTLSSRLAPKTIKDIHGFVSAVIRSCRPNFALSTKLPQKSDDGLYIPDEEDIKALLSAISGTDLELPVMLAAFGPMRRGEICALRSENINGATVHVCENMVCKSVDHHKEWIIKQPKSSAGDRLILYPDFVAEKFPRAPGRIVDMTPDVLTARFWRMLKRNGIEHFRFHDLRHYSASFLHAAGMPDVYIMQRGGWNTDSTLKQVYRHALASEAEKQNKAVNDQFEKIYATRNATRK